PAAHHPPDRYDNTVPGRGWFCAHGELADDRPATAHERQCAPPGAQGDPGRGGHTGDPTMNTPIRRLAVFSMILFGALMLQATWIQGFQADAIREDPLNNRQYSERLTEQRGPIQVAGEPVAYSEDVSEEDDQARYQRMYNGGDLYTPIVGSFRSYGASGVEEAENSLLDGSDDRLAARNLRDILTGHDPGGAR